MSRDVEVLRDDGGGHGTMLIRFSPTRAYRLYLDGTATGAELKADMDLISAAISALEEKEAPQHPFTPYRVDGEVCKVCEGKHSDHRPKSSSDSMEERIRDAALREAMDAVSTAGGPDASWHCGVIRALMTTDIAVHPHQSWCRGDHSEGACVPDSMEADRGD
jgi:hypothetical protein